MNIYIRIYSLAKTIVSRSYTDTDILPVVILGLCAVKVQNFIFSRLAVQANFSLRIQYPVSSLISTILRAKVTDLTVEEIDPAKSCFRILTFVSDAECAAVYARVRSLECNSGSIRSCDRSHALIVFVEIRVAGCIDHIRNGTSGEEQNRLISLVNQSLQLLTGLSEVTIIDSAQIVEALDPFHCFFVTVIRCYALDLVGVGIQCDGIFLAGGIRSIRHQNECIDQPVLHTAVPSLSSAADSYAIGFVLQEFLAGIIKLIGCGGNIDTHLIQVTFIYPHFSTILAVVADIDISQGIDLSVSLFCHIQTVGLHHL